MLRSKFRLVVAIAVFGCFSGFATSASGVETAITLGTGELPSIAVDSNGTAHVAWNQRVGGSVDYIQYCTIPHGGTSCTPTTVYSGAPATMNTTDPSAKPNVVIDSSGITRIYSKRCCGITTTQLWTETGVGTNTFTGPTEAGSNQGGGMAILSADGNNVYSITSQYAFGNTLFQSIPIGGGTLASNAILSANSEDRFDGTIALDGSTPVTAFSPSGVAPVYYSRFTGTDPNTNADWTRSSVNFATGPSLAGGSLGVYMLARTTNGTPVYKAYKYTNTGGSGTMNEAATITPESEGISSGTQKISSLVQGGGLLTAMYRRSSDLRCAISTNGATWQGPQTVVNESSISNLMGAATSSGSSNWAVWDNGGGGSSGTVRLVEFKPSVCGNSTTTTTPTDTTGSTTGGGGTTTGGTTTTTPTTTTTTPGITCKKPNVLVGSKCIIKKDGLEIEVPKNCIKSGGIYKVTLRQKAKIRRANRKIVVKVKSALFTLNYKLTSGKTKKLSKNIKKPPFVVRYRLTKAAPGVLTLKLKARIKTKKSDSKHNKRARTVTVKGCVI